MGGRTQAFGVVAPPARQGAALKKNGGPDARTIVDGILFYVKNLSGLHDIPSGLDRPELDYL